MATKTTIKKNTYFDFVSLMALTAKGNRIEGIRQVNIAMGTSMNKDVFKMQDCILRRSKRPSRDTS